MARGLSIVSIIAGFVGTITSAYFFAVGRLNFEQIFWIIIGLLFFMIIMIYQDIYKELNNQKWELKRVDEKFKIYKRLSELEKAVFKNGKKK